MKIICSSSAGFNPASRDFATRVLFFQQLVRKKSLPLKNLLAVMVGDALLAVMAKSNRVLPIMARRAR